MNRKKQRNKRPAIRGRRLAAGVGIAVGVLALFWLAVFVSIPRPLFDDPYSTTVYSAEGDLLGARIAPDGQWRFPETDSLPGKFVTCLVCFEDKRFFSHPGVDLLAMGRAVRQNRRAGGIVSGGSTLTMQLARIARGNKPRTVGQKLVETLWAVNLETTHSKDEILRLYASHAPFGGNVVGLETAAWRYFGRPAEELSWAECAALAVLPNSPALIHPGRNRDALRAKRDGLLLTLHERGIIDRDDYELSLMEPLPDNPLPLPSHAPHLTERLAARAPGTEIRTTVESAMQRRAQETVDRYAREYAANHIHNVAAIIADVRTGEVLAYCGNASFPAAERHGNSVDVITAERSTGSILKPLLYAGMLNDGMILPGTLIADTPLNINGFSPQNYNRTYNGAVPAHRAVERSLNVPLVRMLSRYNTGRFMSLLRSCGMTTLRFPEDHYGASLILGGAEGTLWDMAGIYASLGRVMLHYPDYDGRYDPADIHPLTLQGTETTAPIVSSTDDRLRDRGVLSAASIWFALDAMTALSRPEEEAEWEQFRSMKRVAWKTGTSYGGRDGWAIGLTPRYVVGVWVGNASGEGRAGLTGVGYAAPVLFELFSMLPGSGWFLMPYGEMAKVPVCLDSGHRASEICDRVDSLHIPAAGIATAVCPYHRTIHLSADGRHRVNSSCESVGNMTTAPWFVLPPAQEYYYRNYHPEYRPLPPFRAGCRQAAERSIDIIYPEHGSVVYMPVGFSGQREKIVLKAAHSDPEASIFWYIDEEYIGTTVTRHETAIHTRPGEHLLTLTDNNGNTRRILFIVK